VAVEKVLLLSSTPIPIVIGTPKGDFLEYNMLLIPPWGVKGCKTTFSIIPLRWIKLISYDYED
jgi:hypothetical protein